MEGGRSGPEPQNPGGSSIVGRGPVLDLKRGRERAGQARFGSGAGGPGGTGPGRVFRGGSRRVERRENGENEDDDLHEKGEVCDGEAEKGAGSKPEEKDGFWGYSHPVN